MGRNMQPRIYEKGNFWIGKDEPRPAAGKLEALDHGNLFSPNISLKQPFKNFSVNHWLSTASAKNFTSLLPYMERVSFKSNEFLYHSGKKIDYVYFPETAVISEFQFLEDGRTIEIAMTGKEGLTGFLPVISLKANINWTQVCIPGNALRVNSKVFESEVMKNPALQSALFDYVSIYVGQLSQRSVCNSYHSIEQRFCSWLLMLQDRRESGKFTLTQEQIARSLGAHRPSVTHIAQNLRERKIIDYVRGKIFIQNRSELEKAACSCHLEIDKNFAGQPANLVKTESKFYYG